MKSAVKETIKLLLISLIISFLVTGGEFSFSAYIFVYFLSLLVLPYWLKNNNINWGMRLFLTIFVGVTSVSTITYIYGTGKTLHRYIAVFGIVVIVCTVTNYIKKNIKC